MHFCLTTYMLMKTILFRVVNTRERNLISARKKLIFCFQGIDSCYTISFNKPIELKESSSIKRANSDGFVYFVT